MEANNYFVDVARKLLDLFKSPELGDYLEIYDSPLNGSFGIRLMRYSEKDGVVDYHGTQSKAVGNRIPARKQGLFDFQVSTGERYLTPKRRQPKKATHRDLFEDLLAYSSEDYCLRVWRGENPIHVGDNEDEKEALVTMFLMMLEQEVNWGIMEWQKHHTNFWPGNNKHSPPDCRPRDMIMGFLRQAFVLGIGHLDELKYWMFSYGRPVTTTWFGDRKEAGSWPRYIEVNPVEAELFIGLSKISNTARVMDNGVELEFAEEAGRHPDNPGYRAQ